MITDYVKARKAKRMAEVCVCNHSRGNHQTTDKGCDQCMCAEFAVPVTPLPKWWLQRRCGDEP